MEYTVILTFMEQYGLMFLFLIVFLEYMNLPGFPSGIILPVSGIWVATSANNFLFAFTISIVAGLVGSLFLFFVGKKGGDVVLGKYLKKFPSHKPVIDKYTNKFKKNENKTLFISKLIPSVRTIIGIPAGMVNMKLSNYIIYSSMGIAIWNGVFMFAGYFLGEAAFTLF